MASPPPPRTPDPRRRPERPAFAAAAAAHQRLRRGCPARGVPAVGPGGCCCGGGGPVREESLVRVLREERVHQLQLLQLHQRVPYNAPERDWLLEHHCDPTGSLQLDGAGLSGFEQ